MICVQILAFLSFSGIHQTSVKPTEYLVYMQNMQISTKNNIFRIHQTSLHLGKWGVIFRVWALSQYGNWASGLDV